MSSTIFGPIIQHAFVVRDMDAALRYWIEVMGVGPFFRIDTARYREAIYRDESCLPQYSISLAYWGENQIELVSPTSDVPSIYNEFLEEGHDGLLHHMCVTVENMADFRRGIDPGKFETLAEMALMPEGHILYLRGKGQSWPLIEVGEFSPSLYDFFAQVKAASEDWDGMDPVRIV
jgi:methylmalonyl-CoA/ethylmalonyl-CoA epimerase